ncbi:MAG: hypothetical protein GY851_04635, partial [bacterium]|nr:hypothetical protein [bacterium]
MFSRNTLIILSVCGILLAAPLASAKTMVLAENGNPAMTIVTERDPDGIVLQAAEDVQRYVKRMCGVELPLRTDGDRADGPGIYIGRCGRRSWQHLPPAGGNPETFGVAVRGDSIYLTGYQSPAVAFAAVSFMEDELGVRWFAPGALWEYVPEGTPGGLSVDVMERVVEPDWSCRVWSGHGWTEEWRAWLLHNKALCIPPVPFRNMQNFMHKIFAPEKYGES